MAKQDNNESRWQKWTSGVRAEFNKIIWPTREDIRKETTEEFLASLTENQRKVLMLFAEGYKEYEIARKFGIKIAAVSRTISRVIDRAKSNKNFFSI